MRIPVYFVRCRSTTRLFLILVSLIAILLVFNGGIFITSPFYYNSYGSSGPSDSMALKYKLTRLGEDYVRALSEEQRNVQDGPYSGYTTYYDLKKTIAVLIESMLDRLNKIENTLGFLNSSVNGDSSAINARDLLAGAQEKCELPANWNHTHKNCEEKIKWMEAFWKSDPCYASYHVDGSRCSFIIYLSEVEQFCPKLPWRLNFGGTTGMPRFKQASYRFDLRGLFDIMTDNPKNYQWIKMRIERLWPKWVNAYKHLEEKQNWTLTKRVRRKVLLHLGFLTKETGFKFGEKSLIGGPLGELVQWSDLIASLYVLGHELIISSEIETFKNYAQADPSFKSSCPILNGERLDIIYTDIVGLRQMRKKIPASLQNYKCRLRVLDSFGTHAEFNHQPYFVKMKEYLGGKKKNPWGGHSLNLQQFYNMYPHSPDNTFLGFVVETFQNISDLEAQALKPEKENWALIYGKEAYMWKDSKDYIDVIKDLVEIHATVALAEDKLPSFVKNHGILNTQDLHKLLRKVKIFVGLGFPHEGPAPLEAIANGAVFLNPKFNPPKGRQTDKFFEDKPTLRMLTSQNPYAEDFISEPHVITIDISNHTAVRLAIQNTLNTEVTPFLPYEFTHEGMLERVNAFVTHQDFCQDDNNWPPFSASHLIMSKPNQSCKDACWEQGFICERSYFPKINNVDTLKRFGKCSRVEEVESVDAPSILSGKGECRFQKEPLLFSCASQARDSLERLCPCRDYIKDQAALCAACL